MKRKLLTIIMATALTAAAYSQDYNTGIGLRAGTGWGITLKHFVSSRHAFEGFLYGYYNGFNATGLYEFHDRAFDVDNLRWYCGFGAHAGSYNYIDRDRRHDYVKSHFIIGIDGIIGLEYTFTEAPINVGLDWNPYINLTSRTGLYSSGAISIRYTF